MTDGAAGTDAIRMVVVGGDELARNLGVLLAQVQSGTSVLILDKRTGMVRGTIVPGLPADLEDGAALVYQATTSAGKVVDRPMTFAGNGHGHNGNGKH